MIAVCLLLFAVLSSAQVPILPEQYTALQQFMIAGLGRVLQLNTSACPPNLSPPNGRVACDTKGRITQLYLNRANLQGNFSDAISRLTDLTYLNLSDNMLVSGVWHLASLTNLETLDLSYNAMIGDVLSVVENLPYLRSCVLQIPSPRDTNCFSGRLESNATVCNDARLSPLNLCRTYIERVTVVTSPTTSAKLTTTFYTGPRSTSSSSNAPTTTTATTTTVSTTLRSTTTTTATAVATTTTTQTTKPAVPNTMVSATTVVGQFSLMSEQRTGNQPSTSTDSGTLAPSPTMQPTSTTDQFSTTTTTTTTSAAESQTTVSAIPSVSIAVSATTAADQHLAVVILGVVVAVLYVSIVLYVVVSKLRKRRTLARMNSLNTGPFQLASELLDVADIASQDGGDGSSTTDEHAPSSGGGGGGGGGKGASRAEPIYDRVFSDGAGGFKAPGAASQNGEYDNLGVVSSQVPHAVSPTLRHRVGAAAAAAAAASSSALPPPMPAAYSLLPPPITDRVDASTGDGGSYARVKTKGIGNYSLVKVDSAKTVYDDVEAPFN